MPAARLGYATFRRIKAGDGTRFFAGQKTIMMQALGFEDAKQTLIGACSFPRCVHILSFKNAEIDLFVSTGMRATLESEKNLKSRFV